MSTRASLAARSKVIIEFAGSVNRGEIDWLSADEWRREVYRMWYTLDHRNMSRPVESSGLKRIEAAFFRTEAGGEPLREWLKALSPIEDRRIWLAYRNAGV